MNNKIIYLLIFSIAVVILVPTYIYYSHIDEQNRKVHESHWVKDCIPKSNDAIIPAIGIENSTHNFDLRNCVWSLKN